MSRKVIAAVTDLFFVAKLKSAAPHAEVNLTFASSPGEVMAEVRSGGHLVILDLNDPVLDAPELIRTLRDDPATADVPTLAFYSHVETGLADQARDAGCDQILPRSQFSRRLVELLRGS